MFCTTCRIFRIALVLHRDQTKICFVALPSFPYLVEWRRSNNFENTMWVNSMVSSLLSGQNHTFLVWSLCTNAISAPPPSTTFLFLKPLSIMVGGLRGVGGGGGVLTRFRLEYRLVFHPSPPPHTFPRTWYLGGGDIACRRIIAGTRVGEQMLGGIEEWWARVKGKVVVVFWTWCCAKALVCIVGCSDFDFFSHFEV
jgi:hypothetical protein